MVQFPCGSEAFHSSLAALNPISVIPVPVDPPGFPYLQKQKLPSISQSMLVHLRPVATTGFYGGKSVCKSTTMEFVGTYGHSNSMCGSLLGVLRQFARQVARWSGIRRRMAG